MIKEKSIKYLLTVLLIISTSVNLFAWQKIENLESSAEKLKDQNQSRGLELIENEYTEYLDKEFDVWDEKERWATYRNKEYGFEIKYPEEFNEYYRIGDYPGDFEWKKIKIGDFSFDSDRDFYSGQNENKVSDNAHFTFGSFRTINRLIDFNVFEREYVYDNNYRHQIESSLFAIGFHSNESNLPFNEFMSQEILNTCEGIENQRVIKINGVEGYRIVLSLAICSAPLGIVYYLPTQDNKTIISIGVPVELFSERMHTLYEDSELSRFLETYPQYQEEIRKIKNKLKIDINNPSFEEFMDSNSDYKKFMKLLDLEYAKKELNKRLLFEKIVYSFKFY